MTARPARETLPDALRAIAMVSVLVVNAIGYASAPWGPSLGTRVPADSPWAAVVQGLVAALLQGKGYSMLAFVFGMALWLSARGRDRPEALRRGLLRNGRLLRLGIVHGVFVYFGDILTLYALVGRRLLRRLHMPWGAFRRHLWRALGWALVACVLVLIGNLALPTPSADSGEATLSGVGNAWDFLKLNASFYALNQLISALLLSPVIYLCMVCGVAAARLRLLTHRRWRPLLRRWLLRAGPPLLALSLLHGAASAATASSDALPAWIDALGGLIATPLAACYVAALALASAGGRARWCRYLSPLGQRSLTLYVGHGLAGLLLFSGAGLAITTTTVQSVAFGLSLWLLAWTAAARSGSRRWPLEMWMGRRG